MLYIVCDMNCNSYGSYFKVVGLDGEVREEGNSYYVPSTGDHYPKKWCYMARISKVLLGGEKDNLLIKYSEAIDVLLPSEYVRWIRDRFCSGFLKKIYNELEFRENHKTDYLSRMDVMMIIDLLHSSLVE